MVFSDPTTSKAVCYDFLRTLDNIIYHHVWPAYFAAVLPQLIEDCHQKMHSWDELVIDPCATLHDVHLLHANLSIPSINPSFRLLSRWSSVPLLAMMLRKIRSLYPAWNTFMTLLMHQSSPCAPLLGYLVLQLSTRCAHLCMSIGRSSKLSRNGSTVACEETTLFSSSLTLGKVPNVLSG